MNVPQVLAGRYAIEREIGRGGMAVVYLGRDLRHVRDVAVKIFRLEGPEPEEGGQRFLQEIQIAARLSHPNILPLHDSGEADGLLYYVMPYVPGETLRQRLEREGALPVADALQIASEVAGALAYAHSHGVIHRDIKPENILFIAGHAVVADFGIARAISAGGWDEWKLAGPAGTPTYMSPEQARGGSRVDGRSDLYSLGCVLYEMLTGEPPFRGSTPEEVVVQHLEAEPLPVQVRRPALTPELQALVGNALAKHPADRYQTAQQMADALQRVLAGLGPDTTGGSLRAGPASGPVARTEARAAWLGRWAAPLFAAGGIALALFWSIAAGKGGHLDPNLVYVAPFVHREGVPAALEANQCSRLVQSALTRWSDVRLVDPIWTGDQVARLKHPPTLEDLLVIARNARAGRLLTGEVWTWNDSIKVRGVLYDVARSPAVLREKIISIKGDLADAEQRFTELADSLIVPAPAEAASASGVFGTHLIAAWQAYDSGHVALARWDLDDAARHFQSAAALDPQFGLAHLWLAQTLSWRGTPAAGWREEVRAGLAAQPPLAARDRRWGEALLALGESRFPDACRQFTAMIQQDTLDFRAWFGRGECRRMDRVAIRDPKSPSGWAFRASYHAAMRDFERALTLVPSTHRAFKGGAFDRLAGLFVTEVNTIRTGRPDSADTLLLGAFPSLQGDTLAFIPYPLSQVVAGAALPPTTGEIVRRNRQHMAEVTAAWVRAFPASSVALEMNGRALELEGLLDGADPSAPWALAAYQQARMAQGDTTGRLSAGIGQVRVLVKLGRYPAARALADTLLNTAPQQETAVAAGHLASLAALTGRAFLAASLARRAAPDVEFLTTEGQPITLPLAVRETAMGYLALASFQAPPDSLRAVDHQLQYQVDNMVPRKDRTAAVNAVFAVSRSLAYPALGGETYLGAVGGSALLALHRDLLRGDTAAVRKRLDARAQMMPASAAQDVALDLVLREAQLRLEVGDTLGARAELDRALGALPSTGLGLLGDSPVGSIPQAAALPLALALRADLAADRGDLAGARQFASGALALIDQTSTPLSPVVSRMQRFVEATPSQ